MSALVTLLLLALAIACFIGGWLAPELVALLAAGLLMATGVLTPNEALAGFGSPALITLVGLFVLSNGLLHSGALDRLRELLASPRIRNPSQLMLVFGFVVAPISGFIPNTPIVAILLPVVQGWCQRRGISPSRVLMPLSFATLIGGTITLIGTSTSLLASDLVTRLGYGSFELFSFTAIGIPVWLIGACLWIAARQSGLPLKLFDSSTGFHLPDGSVLSPDVSLVRQERWEALSPEQRRSFPPLCPDLVVELASLSDEGPRGAAVLRQKMHCYRRNGAQLGWLLFPAEQAVEIWCAPDDSPPQRIQPALQLNGGPQFPGLTIDLTEVWQS